jgi:hypothetical protein
MSNVVKDAMPRAIQEGFKFVEDSNGLFTNKDMPAFIAGFLACVVVNHKEKNDGTE